MSEMELEGRVFGVTIGIVTNNHDPEGLGRVKLKLPWLSEDIETHWARVATPMAGNGRGLYVLPEVHDEVLVAFEHGMVEFPYVLGSLWNGKDTPPETNEDGKNNRRLLRSRQGHVIVLDDTEGQEHIRICDMTGHNSIVIESAHNTLTIQVEGDVTLRAKGQITIQSDGGDLAFRGHNIALQAQGDCTVQALNNCSVQAQVRLALQGPAGVNINNGALEVI
jgi:uncharacterized protein involved in type VI secretion and phage assembly